MDRPLIEEPVFDPPRSSGGGATKVVICVLVALGLLAGGGYFFGASGLRRLASAGGIGGVGSEEQRRAADSLVKTLHSQVALYKLQHNDNYPDFVKHPNWEQLTKYTDSRGNFVEATNREDRKGPYVQNTPQNPLNGLSTLAIVPGPAAPGDAVPNGQKVGFVFETEKGRFFVTDVAGTTLIDPAAVVGAAPGGKAPASKRAQAAEILTSIVQSARSQVALYKLQHGDANPDFVKYPNWEQLTATTDEKGKPSRAARYGPYFQDAPSNPLHGGTRVQVVPKKPDASFVCKSADVGFVFDASADKVYGLDADGKLIDNN